MSIKPWKILDTTYLHPNVRVDKCELPNGQIIAPHLLEYEDEIMVLALTKNQEVVLIYQYRHGVQEAILELPGGSVDEGESPLDAAKRELLEETGYISNTFVEVGHGSPNPAIYTNVIYYFLALDVEQIGKQSNDNSETIELLLVPLTEVINMAQRGDLMHSLNFSILFFVLGYLNRIS
jgi:ADP-ribose pyrophosphatase